MRRLYHFHVLLAVAALALAAVGALAQTAPRINAGPTAAEEEVSSDGAVIRWTTDMESTTVVEFGLTANLGERYRKIVPISETEIIEMAHAMTLQGLQAGTVYRYRVRSVAADGSSVISDILSFTTKPAPIVEPLPVVVAEPTPVSVATGISSSDAVRVAPVTEPPPVSSSLASLDETPAATVAQKPKPVTIKAEVADTTGAASAGAKVEDMSTSVVADTDRTASAEAAPGDVSSPSLVNTASIDVRILAKVASATLTDACAANAIPATRCAVWLDAKFADTSCERAGIFSHEDCESYMTTKNGGTFPGCAGASAEECADAKERTLVGYIPDDVKSDIDGILRTSSVAQAFVELGDAAPDIIALRVEKSAGARWWPSAFLEGTSSAPGVIVYDADKDGLPDETELRLGTDPANADTDGNGVSDKDDALQAMADRAAQAEKDAAAAKRRGLPPPEVEPSPFAPIDLAFLNGHALEQPLASGTTDSGIRVAAGAPAEGEPDGVTVTGNATPGMVVTLYVYSYVPLVLTTTADENGNFVYELGDSMSDGKHTAYVALTDDEGKIVSKSNPLSFFVNEARAASEEEFLRSDLGAASSVAVVDATRLYLWGAFALVTLGAIYTWSVSRRMTA